MFKQTVYNTQLTTDAANNFFQHITGDSFQRDMTFVSTLRALVAPRMAEGERITLYFASTNYSASQLSDFSTNNAVKQVCDVSRIDNGSIVVHNFNNASQENNFAWLELMKSTFEKVYPGWHRLDKITLFFKKSFYALCFVEPETKKVVLFADSLNMQRMHYLQCAIVAFLPWYFDPSKGVSQLEMKLIESLRMKDSVQYENIIAEIAEQYDFRAAKIRMLLNGFETRYEKVECEEMQVRIQQCIEDINRYNEEIGNILRRKHDFEIKLLGLETKIANGDGESEILDYFMRNSNLILENVTNTTMTFIVKAYLEYFDEDLAETLISNRNSCLYRPNNRGCNNFIPADDMELFLRAVFIDEKLRIKVCAAYSFDLNGNVNAQSGYNYTPECRDCTPNPHIDGFSCIGNYSRAINELLKNRDYIGAIEQCAASCRSLNFGDSIVLAEFARRLYGISERRSNANVRCVELPDGRIVNPVEAIAWLREQEAVTNE